MLCVSGGAGAVIVVAAVAALSTGCNWARFTKLKKDAPAVRFEPPDSYSGQYADTLTVAWNDERSELYVGGLPRSTGGLVYSLGNDDNPQPNPTDSEHCPGSGGGDFCDTVTIPAGLNQSWTPGNDTEELCFVSGYGNIDQDVGLWTRCDNGLQFVFPVPSDTEAGLSAEASEPARELVLATNRSGPQLLLAATSAQGRAWFYEPLTGTPLDVPEPTTSPASFGSRVAVARTASGHLLAVSAPDEAQVWLYRAVGSSIEAIGCLSGGERFGRTLVSGDVDGDGNDDFVVADDEIVAAYSGALLDASPGGVPSDSCDLDSSVNDPKLLELSCENTDETTGCGVSRFGEAIAVVDVDGDGEGEVFVGAPRMEARGMSRAGTVLAYDSQGDLLDVVLVSDIAEKDEFGGSLAAVPQGEREILAVGAVGSNEVFLFYCAAGSDGEGSARCK